MDSATGLDVDGSGAGAAGVDLDFGDGSGMEIDFKRVMAFDIGAHLRKDADRVSAGGGSLVSAEAIGGGGTERAGGGGAESGQTHLLYLYIITLAPSP